MTASIATPQYLVADPENIPAADLVREAIRLSGLSQKRFAKLMGMPPETVCRWMLGRRRVPRWAGRAALGAALLAGVSIRLPNPGRNVHGA